MIKMSDLFLMKDFYLEPPWSNSNQKFLEITQFMKHLFPLVRCKASQDSDTESGETGKVSTKSPPNFLLGSIFQPTP